MLTCNPNCKTGSEMSEVFTYTGKDIERATGGYVNSGVLRMWVSEGRLKAGGRARSRGGPRTFSAPTVTKAVLMAELRKCGVVLGRAEKLAEQFLRSMKKIQRLHSVSDEKGLDAALLDIPFYFAIKPATGEATAITGRNGIDLFRNVLAPFAPSVTIIYAFEIMQAIEVLHLTETPDE